MAWMRFRKKDMPGGLWVKCPKCSEMLFQKDLEENFKTCKKCEYLFPLTVDERIRFLLDPDTFVECDADMSTLDALEFVDQSSYPEKIDRTQKKTGRAEAMVYGIGKLRGQEIVFGCLEFGFLGGSMGVVVGEKVARAAELALARKLPLILFSSSGGARMHEGALSLMQMAKTCAALARLSSAGGLYISVLAHPTTGGVTASWATMADLVLAEPNALIGFAGPRVIKNTIRQDLPEGFQTAEFLLKKGQLDRIVQRHELADEIGKILHFCLGADPDASSEAPVAQGEKASVADANAAAPESDSKKKPSKKKRDGEGRQRQATKEAQRKTEKSAPRDAATQMKAARGGKR